MEKKSVRVFFPPQTGTSRWTAWHELMHLQLKKSNLIVLIDNDVMSNHNRYFDLEHVRPSAEALKKHWALVRQDVNQTEAEADFFAATFLANTSSQTPAMPPVEPQKIEVAPGFWLHGVLSSVCTKRLREEVLDQLLYDGTEQYQERLFKGDKWGARLVRWSMRGWMLRAVFGGFISGFFSLLTWKRKSSD